METIPKRCQDAATIWPPAVPTLGRHRRSPLRREKPYRRPFYPPKNTNVSPRLQKELMFFCGVISESHLFTAWGGDFGHSRSHAGALGRGTRSLRSQTPPQTTAQPCSAQMEKPETQPLFSRLGLQLGEQESYGLGPGWGSVIENGGCPPKYYTA